MLRRTLWLPKVTRSWTKSSISASAHFPDAVTVDPAASRTAHTSAKETRDWSLNDGAGPSCTVPPPTPPKPVSFIVKKIKIYGNLVRFDRPAGWQLLVLPCYWGSALAVTQAIVREGADPIVLCAPFIPMHLAIYFLAGSYLMRSAGCIVNDMWDRKFDAQVERTADRPLACGACSMGEAVVLLGLHLAAALVVVLNLSPVALTTAFVVTPLWIIYPFMKRITYMPQLMLGLCFNWGIFVGYAAVLGRIDWAVTLPIYLGSVIWCILYDTIYAYQDRKDDVKCGVKSLAIWMGDRKDLLQMMVPPLGIGMVVSGLMVSQSLPYYIGSALCTYRLYTIVEDVNINDRWSCWNGWKKNVGLALYVLLSMFLGNLFWTLASEYEEERVTDDSVGSSSTLAKVLFFDRKKESMLYDPEGFNWFDRMVHPAFVQAEVAKAKGETEPPVVPAWMRREYLGENVSTILRFAGVPEERIASGLEWWYSLSDHYSMFSQTKI